MGTQNSMSASIELPARALSGLVMAATAVFVTLAGVPVFACFVVLGSMAALREWHRLVNGGQFANETFVSALSVAVAVLILVLVKQPEPAFSVLAVGFCGAFLWAARRKQAPFWHAVGPIYVGLAALALVLLRAAPAGAYLILGIFIAVWSADTGALFGGRLIGGPKLVPRLSPNKTWAGLVTGTLAAGAAEAAFLSILGGSAAAGLALGFFIAVVGHGGDLFESWVKRRFRAKDSGGLIPGHGGVLDRIDSLLFVAPACAILVTAYGLSPLYGPI